MIKIPIDNRQVVNFVLSICGKLIHCYPTQEVKKWQDKYYKKVEMINWSPRQFPWPFFSRRDQNSPDREKSFNWARFVTFPSFRLVKQQKRGKKMKNWIFPPMQWSFLSVRLSSSNSSGSNRIDSGDKKQFHWNTNRWNKKRVEHFRNDFHDLSTSIVK